MEKIVKNPLSCQRQEVSNAEIEKLQAWAKTLRYKDFGCRFDDDCGVLTGIGQCDVERSLDIYGNKPLNRIIFYGDLFLVDAEPGKLMLCRYLKKPRKWRDTAFKRAVQYIATICEDTRGTFGDNVNGYWLLPDLTKI